jgi:hypothetical protein
VAQKDFLGQATLVGQGSGVGDWLGTAPVRFTQLTRPSGEEGTGLEKEVARGLTSGAT